MKSGSSSADASAAKVDRGCPRRKGAGQALLGLWPDHGDGLHSVLAFDRCRVDGESHFLCYDCLGHPRSCWCMPAKRKQLSGEKWSNRYLCMVTVVILDNSSKRFGAYIAHTLTRASDVPPSRQAQKAPFSVVGKGLSGNTLTSRAYQPPCRSAMKPGTVTEMLLAPSALGPPHARLPPLTSPTE